MGPRRLQTTLTVDAPNLCLHAGGISQALKELIRGQGDEALCPAQPGMRPLPQQPFTGHQGQNRITNPCCLLLVHAEKLHPTGERINKRFDLPPFLINSFPFPPFGGL
jgi:hypothetical protein